MKWFWILCDLFFIICALALVYTFCGISTEEWDRLFPLGSGSPVRVFIAPGKNGREIADVFRSADIVPSAPELARWLHRFALDRSFRPGTYSVRKGTPWEVARQLRSAVPERITLTIVPGSDLFSLGDTVSASPQILRKVLADDSFFPAQLLSLLPASADQRIAFLLPETYDVPEQSFAALVKTSSVLWQNRLFDRLSGLTSRDILEAAIIASLVERETSRESERPRIAGVIRNRLGIGMPLQIDATVVYAWKRRGRTITRVLHKDLEIDSPLNTYRITGLPPEPICIPSEGSWKAALQPEENDFLYYVLKKDGLHVFAKKYSEHLRNIRVIRR
jgi:UPF0755 protein